MFSEFFSILVLISLLYFWLRPYYYANNIIHKWVKKNHYSILEKELKLFDTGPFGFIENFYYAVYFLKIVDRERNVRSCWVACGDLFLLHPDSIRVAWNKTTKKRLPFTSFYFSILNFVQLLAFIVLYIYLFGKKLF